jgi:hypothetical protein
MNDVNSLILKGLAVASDHLSARHALGLEAQEGADIGLVPFPPAPLRKPGFDLGHRQISPRIAPPRPHFPGSLRA